MPRVSLRDFPYSLQSNGTGGNVAAIINSAIAPTELQTIGEDGGKYSVLLRFKTTDTNTSAFAWMSAEGLFGFRQETASNTTAPFHLGVRDNKLHFGRTSLYSSQAETFLSTTTINDGKWHWALCTVNDDTLKIFIDGVLDSTNTFVTAVNDCSAGASVAANMQLLSRSTDAGAYTGSAAAYVAEAAVWEEDLSDGAADLFFKANDLTKGTGAYSDTMADSLKGWWKPMSGDATTVIDRTSFGNDGTITGLTVESDSPMKQRLAARDFPYSNTFDGAADAIALDGSDLPIYPINGLGTYSIELWFKVTDLSLLNPNVFSESEASGSDQEWQWRFNANGTLELILQNDADATVYTLDTTTVFKENKWYHIVYTDSSGDADFYVNGVLDATDFDYTPSGPVTFDSTTLGAITRSGTGLANFFKGEITRPVIYSTKLTAQEVSDRFYKNTLASSAVAEYLVDEGSGTTLADNIGDNTGTLVSSTAWSPETPHKMRKAVRDIPYSLESLGLTTDKIKCGTDDSLSVINSDCAVFLWSKTNPVVDTSLQGLITKRTGSDPNVEWYLYTSSGNLILGVDATPAISVSASVLPANQWALHGFTRTGDVWNYYVNGNKVYEGSNAAVTVHTGQELVVGNLTASLSFSIKGNYSIPRIWNDTLTADEVRSMYYDNIIPKTGNLVLELLMGEGSGTAVADTSGQGNNGTITKADWSPNSPF